MNKKKAESGKKTGKASVPRRQIDKDQILKSMPPRPSRLMIEMPLSSAGEIRLAIIDGRRRVSAWGSGMEEALDRLNAKLQEDGHEMRGWNSDMEAALRRLGTQITG